MTEIKGLLQEKQELLAKIKKLDRSGWSSKIQELAFAQGAAHLIQIFLTRLADFESIWEA